MSKVEELQNELLKQSKDLNKLQEKRLKTQEGDMEQLNSEVAELESGILELQNELDSFRSENKTLKLSEKNRRDFKIYRKVTKEMIVDYEKNAERINSKIDAYNSALEKAQKALIELDSLVWQRNSHVQGAFSTIEKIGDMSVTSPEIMEYIEGFREGLKENKKAKLNMKPKFKKLLFLPLEELAKDVPSHLTWKKFNEMGKEENSKLTLSLPDKAQVYLAFYYAVLGVVVNYTKNIDSKPEVKELTEKIEKQSKIVEQTEAELENAEHELIAAKNCYSGKHPQQSIEQLEKRVSTIQKFKKLQKLEEVENA